MGVSGIVTLLILICGDDLSSKILYPNLNPFHKFWLSETMILHGILLGTLLLCVLYIDFTGTSWNEQQRICMICFTNGLQHGMNRAHSRWVQLPFEDVVQRSGQGIIASAYIRGLVPHTQQRPVSWRCWLVVVINGGIFVFLAGWEIMMMY